jgi:hypothetical protein
VSQHREEKSKNGFTLGVPRAGDKVSKYKKQNEDPDLHYKNLVEVNDPSRNPGHSPQREFGIPGKIPVGNLRPFPNDEQRDAARSKRAKRGFP